MKRASFTIALLSALSLIPVGCQKENINDYITAASFSEMDMEHTILYSIDGIPYKTLLHDNNDRTKLFHHLFEMVQNGHSVYLYDTSKASQDISTKEIVCFSTTNKEEANAWADKMVDNGYKVSITFDTENGTYKCVARR